MDKVKRLLAIVGVLGVSMLAASSSSAQTSDGLTEPSFYSCMIVIFAKDLANGHYAEQKFQAPVAASSSHGGDSFDFELEHYKVSLLTNGRWMGISWFRGEQLITQSIFLRQFNSWEAQVLMAFNPANLEEYASLDCVPQ